MTRKNCPNVTFWVKKEEPLTWSQIANAEREIERQQIQQAINDLYSRASQEMFTTATTRYYQTMINMGINE